MSRRWLSTALVLVAVGLALGACNLPGRPAPTATPTYAPQPAPKRAATFTPKPTRVLPTPTDTEPPPTDTPEPQPPSVAPDGKDILCFFGPGPEYTVGGSFRVGEEAAVLGVDAATLWAQIEPPRLPGKRCWVRLDQVVVMGDLSLAPFVPPPINFVTAVTVELSPETIDLNPCVFPTTFDVSFTIEVTGPTTVTFQRSLSNGNSAPPETVTFTDATPMTFSDYYRVGTTGDQWFRVTVTSPNAIVGEGHGTVTCP